MQPCGELAHNSSLEEHIQDLENAEEVAALGHLRSFRGYIQELSSEDLLVSCTAVSITVDRPRLRVQGGRDGGSGIVFDVCFDRLWRHIGLIIRAVEETDSRALALLRHEPRTQPSRSHLR